MSTGSRIRDLREASGLSQTALGEIVGVTQQSVYAWERDISLPDIMSLQALADNYGVTTDFLLCRDEKSPSAICTAELLTRTFRNEKGRDPTPKEASALIEFTNTYIKGLDK